MNELLRRAFLLFGLVIVGVSTWAAERDEAWRDRSIDVIDIPTAEVVDHYGYNVLFRFGKEGAVQNKSTFGIFPRLSLGFGLDTEELIGTEDARLNKPTLNLKFRLFDGKSKLPALAIGFDGQGYQWNKATDEYDQREKGLYLVATEELFFPDFKVHLGGNYYGFDTGENVQAFMGLTYVFDQKLGLMVEYDSLTEYDDRRINYGAKYYVTPVFTVDFCGRNTAEEPGGDSRETERIVRLSYTGSF